MLTLEVAHVIVAIVVVGCFDSGSSTDFLEKRDKLSHQSGRS